MGPLLTARALRDDAIVVLDIDDTLFLEETYVRSGFRAVGGYLQSAMGVSGIGDVLWLSFLKGVRDRTFNQVLPEFGIEPTATLVATLVAVYRSHLPTIEVTPDAALFLRSLRDRPAAAITDGPAESQRRKVEALGLAIHLDPIVYTSELGPAFSKPHHRAFELIERSMRAAPSRCVYIADNPHKDFKAPTERGWTSYRVRRPSSLHQAIPTPSDVIEIETLDVFLKDSSLNVYQRGRS